MTYIPKPGELVRIVAVAARSSRPTRAVGDVGVVAVARKPEFNSFWRGWTYVRLAGDDWGTMCHVEPAAAPAPERRQCHWCSAPGTVHVEFTDDGPCELWACVYCDRRVGSHYERSESILDYRIAAARAEQDDAPECAWATATWDGES